MTNYEITVTREASYLIEASSEDDARQQALKLFNANRPEDESAEVTQLSRED